MRIISKLLEWGSNEIAPYLVARAITLMSSIDDFGEEMTVSVYSNDMHL